MDFVHPRYETKSNFVTLARLAEPAPSLSFFSGQAAEHVVLRAANALHLKEHLVPELTLISKIPQHKGIMRSWPN